MLDDGVSHPAFALFLLPCSPSRDILLHFHLICGQCLYYYAYASVYPHSRKCTVFFLLNFVFLGANDCRLCFVFFVYTANYFLYFQGSFSVQFSIRLITLQTLPESVFGTSLLQTSVLLSGVVVSQACHTAWDLPHNLLGLSFAFLLDWVCFLSPFLPAVCFPACRESSSSQLCGSGR